VVPSHRDRTWSANQLKLLLDLVWLMAASIRSSFA